LGDTGISPEHKLLILRSDTGVYAYSGVIGSLQETLLNAQAGIKDSQSAQLIPITDEFVALIWLGDDGQFWKTDGTNAYPISVDQILPTLVIAYRSAIASNANPRFPSGYNKDYQYYFCTVGAVQFCWRWVTKAWFLCQGWPIGPTFKSVDQNRLPAYFVASSAAINLNPFVVNQSFLGGIDVLANSSGPQQAYGIAQIAQIGLNDNGVMPAVFWTSPELHGGAWSHWKECHEIEISTLDTGVLYNVTCSASPQQNGAIQTAKTLQLQAPNNSGFPFILNQSVLGGINVLADPIIQALQAARPVSLQGKTAVTIPPSQWWPQGDSMALQGNSVQVTVSYGGGTNAFDLLAMELFFYDRGTRRGNGTFYNPDAITIAPFDPLLGPLNP
jgi:hypothetical protein